MDTPIDEYYSQFKRSNFRIVFKIKPGVYRNGKTTSWVATWLNERYTLIDLYFSYYKKQVGEEMIALLMRYFTNKKKYPDILELPKATNRFRRCLRSKWFDHKAAGIPTKASLTRRGTYRTSRKLPRPSFIETGLFYKSLYIALERY